MKKNKDAHVHSNINELKKIIEAVYFDREVALEFLEAITEHVTELESDYDDIVDDNREKESEISTLEEKLEYTISEDDADIIETPLGNVLIINETGNLKLGAAIENFTDKLQSI